MCTQRHRTHNDNQFWSEILLSCRTRKDSENGTGHHKTRIRERQNTGQSYMGSVTAGKGVRGHASEFLRSEQCQPTHQTRVQEGDASNKDRQCRHKKGSNSQPQATPPRLEGKSSGTGVVAVKGTRDLDMQWLNQSLSYHPHSGLAEYCGSPPGIAKLAPASSTLNPLRPLLTLISPFRLPKYE